MIKNEEQALVVDPFEGDYGDSTDAVQFLPADD